MSQRKYAQEILECFKLSENESVISQTLWDARKVIKEKFMAL